MNVLNVHCPECKSVYDSRLMSSHNCKIDKTIETLRAILSIAAIEHGSMRALGEAIGVPTSTVHAWITGARKPGKLAQRTLWQEMDRLGVTDRWMQAK